MNQIKVQISISGGGGGGFRGRGGAGGGGKFQKSIHVHFRTFLLTYASFFYLFQVVEVRQ